MDRNNMANLKINKIQQEKRNKQKMKEIKSEWYNLRPVLGCAN